MSRYIIAALNVIALLVLTSCVLTLPNAAETGDTARLQELLHQGFPVDQRGGSMDETALVVAARRGNLEIVKILLNAGADINAKTKYGDTSLTAATHFCHPYIAEYLIEQGADVNAKNDGFGSTPLMLASECNDLEIVKTLIKKGAKIDEKNKSGGTSLMAASAKGHGEIVQSLIRLGADVNLTESRGNDALQYAVYRGHLSVVKALLENGAMPNRKNQSGMLPLHVAIYQNNSSIAKLLLSMGANPNITALLDPKIAGTMQKAGTLQENDLNRDAIDKIKSGQVEISSLMYATQQGNMEIVKELLAKGADVNFSNGIGGSALSYSITFKHKDIENLLIKAGALK